VIVGASSGIGAGLAQYLSADAKKRSKNITLALVARRENELKKVAESTKNEYCSTLIIQADATKRGEVQKVLDHVKCEFGSIAVWINNVGLGITRSVLELTDDDVDTMVRVNIKSALYGMQVAIPYFREQGYGHLINISTSLARVPYVSSRSMYSAAKAALNSLTTNLRMDLQADDRCDKIHVTTVIPGMVQTDFATHAIGGQSATSSSQPKAPFLGPFPRTVQSVDDVSKIICDAIYSDNPPKDLFTNPAHPPLIKQYYDDVGEFERLLKPPQSSS